MTIFLTILLAIFSYLATIGITLKGAFDIIMIFPKKGYILNPDSLEEHKKKVHSVNVSSKSAFLIYVPVINMIYTSYIMNKITNAVFEEMKKYPKVLVPMTEEEKQEFKKRKGYFKKLDYFMKLAASLKKDEIIDVESFEAIPDTEETPEENKILNEYRKLRNEVNIVNTLNSEIEQKDEQTLAKKM